MGKGKRNRARRQQSQRSQPRGSARVLDPRDLDSLTEVVQPDMPGRATYLTDPVLGHGQPVSGIGPGGRLLTEDNGTTEPLPVVLFEPAHAVVLQNTGTGLMQEARIEGIIAAGFGRIPPHPVWTVRPALGWEVRRRAGELVLRDGGGEIWATSKITPDPAWVSAAASYQHVIVFFGPQLGVRVPPGTSPADYATARRAAEFQAARRRGLVAAATVAWRGEATDETLQWVTFPPGSFGQPLPVVFAPAADFARYGGPGVFGLARLLEHGGQLGVRADPVQTLAARVTRTDIDLLDLAEDPGWIGGVHYSEGLPPVWRQTALDHGYVLVLTGRSIPITPGPVSPQELEGLWGAIVPVQPGQRGAP